MSSAPIRHAGRLQSLRAGLAVELAPDLINGCSNSTLRPKLAGMRKLLGSFLTVCLLVGVAFASDKNPITDGYIHDEVQLKLAEDTVVKGGGLVVQVVDGVVTLSGQVVTCPVFLNHS